MTLLLHQRTERKLSLTLYTLTRARAYKKVNPVTLNTISRFLRFFIMIFFFKEVREHLAFIFQSDIARSVFKMREYYVTLGIFSDFYKWYITLKPRPLFKGSKKSSIE